MDTRGPNRLELKKHLDAGLSQREIAELYGVSRSAIGMAKARYGLDGAGRTVGRYADLLPWAVRKEHRMAWDARMLRLEGRRREGRDMSDDELKWLQSWREQLDEQNAVIAYNPRTAKGWHWVTRRDTDTDIVRMPEDARK